MLQNLVEAGVVFLAVAGVAYLTGLAVAHLLEQAAARSLGVDGLDDRLRKVAGLSHRFEQRRAALLPRLAQLDAQLKSARRRHYMVTRRVADMQVSRSKLMRVLGEEDAFQRPERPARRFLAQVVNRHVQRAQSERKEHPTLSPSWARSQQVLVWTYSIAEAKVMIERAFPPAMGFFIIEISESGDADGAASAPATAARSDGVS